MATASSKHSDPPPPSAATAAFVSPTSDATSDRLLLGSVTSDAVNVDTDDADTDDEPVPSPASSSLHHLIRSTLNKATTASVHLSNESPFRHLYCQCKHHLVMQACSEAAASAHVAGFRSQFDDATIAGVDQLASEHGSGSVMTATPPPPPGMMVGGGKEHQQ